MAILHFSKGNLNNPVKLNNGQPVLFERSGDNNGVLALDDQTQAEIAALLNGYADARKMGVRRISPEHYEALKKKPHRVTPVKSVSQPPVRSLNKEGALPKGLRPESRKPSVAAPVSTTPLQLRPSAALLALKKDIAAPPAPVVSTPQPQVTAPAPAAPVAATPEPPKPTGPKTKVAKAKKSTVKLEPPVEGDKANA